MALRSPIYLDTETLLSQAEYYDIEVPRQAEIVEKTVSKRHRDEKASVQDKAGDELADTDVEHQSTYSLKPREKATVSKVIDALIADAAIKVNPDGNTAFNKDDLIEIEGNARITAASLAGKMFFIFRRLMDTAEGDLESIFNFDVEDVPVVEQLKQVYLRNELLPVPILLELTGSSLPQKVYVNVRPDHFIDEASADRIESEMRVLGSISRLIPTGDEGYLSAEEWLLYGWEHMMRRILMTQVDDIVKNLADQLDLNLPAEDVHASIAGPAVVINAIALY
ncbi:hypothetical protein E1281_31640 [Actinomadura sp. KC345]|uniref:DUF6414 family protein n=1 Tax=Actinomadura sp. KC345 TaxID=2530371 RepID=UPI0010477D80|nr:hypothetical protein [Actinomadura sp. KC345]TDC45046.1 hypothetical protein E1281_31640 [Actinomadura sp. KC345]